MSLISTLKSSVDISERINFASRVESLLRQNGASKTWLAKKLGISRQALHHVLKKSTSPKLVSEVAEIFDVSPSWLAFGKGPQYIDNTEQRNVSFVPLYTVGSTLENILFKQIPKTTIPLFEKQNDIMAIQISRYPPMSPNFSDNTIFLFRQHTTPQSGDLVLAHINKTKSNPDVIFRRYTVASNKGYLVALNSKYPTVALCEDDTFLGVLFETRSSFGDDKSNCQ